MNPKIRKNGNSLKFSEIESDEKDDSPFVQLNMHNILQGGQERTKMKEATR